MIRVLKLFTRTKDERGKVCLINPKISKQIVSKFPIQHPLIESRQKVHILTWGAGRKGGGGLIFLLK